MLRYSARALGSKVLSQRTFSTANALRKAEIFKMPAMSPTMEKGGVTSWKFKEGEAFSSGDVLLEVETDKAQIDVEAQDDGILAKIIVNDGGKDIDVGAPIAIIAGPEDDLATLEMPDISGGAKAPAPKAEAPKAEAPKAEAPKATPPTPKAAPKPSTDSSSATSAKANPSQTFFPSVHSLLEENGISRDTAIEKIPATGPQARLLKGDVLAYLGKISTDSVNSISSFINSHSKLDLSNIEKHAIEKKVVKEEAKAAPEKPKKTAPEPITKTFSLEAVLALSDEAPELGIRTFSVREYVEGASKRAERYAYQQHAKKSDYYDAMFEDILAPAKNVDRFSIKLDLPSSRSSAFIKKTDPLDFVDDLLDVAPPSAPQSNEVKVTLTLNPKASDAKDKAEVYLAKLEQYLQVK